ncbi:right-handed parallel beta-helix repeat-containing protein [Paraburkholderia sp. RP-4-7]|uniref:Right-handed parallel beta-helix repeat-containing protein n=1 Tax=Paraburkholderia polaris TaxID=2728848 RepID=A0A848IM44_9BURK|nr:right-handed parallel beta-helix repeat-containing protein [Paraburkholderia polaris]NMM02193.1 right-handed parallel beta-helix repeat-containing protein [Paraburkholderia polaris]
MIKKIEVVLSAVAIASCCATLAYAQPDIAATSSTLTAKKRLSVTGYAKLPATAAVADATIHPSGDGSDQTRIIQAALDALRIGQRLVIAPGTYVVSHSLVVKVQSVVVSGYGATLVATNPGDQSLVVNGTNATVAGLTLRGTGGKRLETESSTKVVVRGTGIQILDTRIEGGASAGIFVSGATNVVLAGNRVSATLADGIHITGGSQNVLVSGNIVIGTGDDMIAIVSYEQDGALSRNILVADNTVSGNYWGRGLSVVGGANVTLSGNTVQGVQKAAGILVAQEDGYRTYNATNVVISNNAVSDIENSTNPANNRPAARHAGIDINTGAGSVSLVLVSGNKVSRTNYDGFRALGNVCQYHVANSAFASIRGLPISVQSRNCASSQIVCGANTLNGKVFAQPVCASVTGEPPITGVDASRLPRINTSARAAR